MQRKPGWWIVLVVAALLVAACGPQMATPTPSDSTASEDASTVGMAPVQTTAPEAAQEGSTGESTPTAKPVSAAELPVDADDWHVLGAPDAPVTIIEYSDFQ